MKLGKRNSPNKTKVQPEPDVLYVEFSCHKCGAWIGTWLGYGPPVIRQARCHDCNQERHLDQTPITAIAAPSGVDD